MRIPSSLSYLMRSVVRKRELPNPFTASRLMHKVAGEREFVRNPTNSFLQIRGFTNMWEGEMPMWEGEIALHVGTKNVGVCFFHYRSGKIDPLVPPLKKEGNDIFGIAKQLKTMTDVFEVVPIIAGHYPWSWEEEEAEVDLLHGAAKVECFMEELSNTRMLDHCYYSYYDTRVVLSPLGLKKKIQLLDKEDERFCGKSESELIQEFGDTYAAQFTLIRSLLSAGGCHYDAPPPDYIAVQQDGDVLTFAFNGIYLGKAFSCTYESAFLRSIQTLSD